MTQEHTTRIWRGKRLAFAVVVFALLAVALSSSCNREANFETANNAPTPPRNATTPARPANGTAPEPLPDSLTQVQMTTLDGKPLKLADYAGKVLVLDLWATWCGPCRLEIPELVALHQDYKERGVEVVGLTIEGMTAAEREEKEDRVRAFASEFKINYTVGWANGDLARAFLLPSGSIPQTYVIGRDGRVVRRFTGYSPMLAPQIRQSVDEALSAGT